MRPAIIVGTVSGAVLLGLGATVAMAPREVKLPVHEGPVTFFEEKQQGITLASLPTGVHSLRAEACGKCHKQEYAEWKQSAHSRSVTEPVFAAAFRSEPRTLCRSCHSPLLDQHPVLVHRMTEPPKLLLNGGRPGTVSGDVLLANAIREKNPHYDAALANEGVTCSTCHVRDGVILSSKPRGSSRVPHPLAYSPELAKADYCGGCHQFDVESPQSHPFERKPAQLAGFFHVPGRNSVRMADGRAVPVSVPAQEGRVVPPPSVAARPEGGDGPSDTPGPQEPPQVPPTLPDGSTPPPDPDEPPIPPDPGMGQQYQEEARVQHTLDEFRISPAAARGETCQSCHMTGDHGRRRRHDWIGRDSLPKLREAVSLSTRLDRTAYRLGEKLQAIIKLRNDAGHKFPTGDSLHAGILDVWLQDGEKTLGRQVFVMTSQRSGPFAQMAIQMDASVLTTQRARVQRRQPFVDVSPVAPAQLIAGESRLEAPHREDTRLLPGEEATLVYSQRVKEELARARNPVLRVRVFHSAVHPGFKNSPIDPSLKGMRLIREERVPVRIGPAGAVAARPGGRTLPRS